MESYKVMNDGSVRRKSDQALIPVTEANKDYVQYLKDVQDGAEALPFDYAADQAKRDEDAIKFKKSKDTEDLIQGKIRDMAIKELKKEGKLDESGSITEAGIPLQ